MNGLSVCVPLIQTSPTRIGLDSRDVRDAVPFIDAFVEHRLAREAGVLAAVRGGISLVPDMVRHLYVGVNERLYKAAGRSVLSHLIKLRDDGLVMHDGPRPGVKVHWQPR